MLKFILLKKAVPLVYRNTRTNVSFYGHEIKIAAELSFHDFAEIAMSWDVINSRTLLLSLVVAYVL